MRTDSSPQTMGKVISNFCKRRNNDIRIEFQEFTKLLRDNVNLKRSAKTEDHNLQFQGWTPEKFVE